LNTPHSYLKDLKKTYKQETVANPIFPIVDQRKCKEKTIVESRIVRKYLRLDISVDKGSDLRSLKAFAL